MNPTYEGFLDFIFDIVGIPEDQIAAGSMILQFAYDYSLNVVFFWLRGVPSQLTSPSIYATAVYNLGADTLINYAPDIPSSSDPNYWSDLRQQFGINAFVGGVINFSSDQSTSEGIAVSDALKQMTMMDLGTLNTPWGRNYMAIAQNMGTLWGIS
jgi:hypothetical protein